MPSMMTTSAPAASAIGCEPSRATPSAFASWEVTSIMGFQSRWESESSRTYHNRRCETQPELGFGGTKSCAQLLGESWARAIRSGTGGGGDVTGSRVSLFPVVSLVGAGGGERGTVVTE